MWAEAKALKPFDPLGDLEAVCYDSITDREVRDGTEREAKFWMPRALNASQRR